jgi:hypothetical protein
MSLYTINTFKLDHLVALRALLGCLTPEEAGRLGLIDLDRCRIVSDPSGDVFLQLRTLAAPRRALESPRIDDRPEKVSEVKKVPDSPTEAPRASEEEVPAYSSDATEEGR